jgi:tRNA U54 and U55 pseudouridine synthase Pus10
MAADQPLEQDFLPVAEVAVDAVQPTRTGFVLRGSGKDSAEYRLDVHFDMPVDHKTHAVLGEILSQSEWRISRRAPARLRQPRPERGRRQSLMP